MKKGFTLVELSIVLVIIGLLIGGILVGQSLVDNVRLKKLVNELQQYEMLTINFVHRYRAIPGDHPDSVIDVDGFYNNDGDLDNHYEAARAWHTFDVLGMLKENYYDYYGTADHYKMGRGVPSSSYTDLTSINFLAGSGWNNNYRLGLVVSEVNSSTLETGGWPNRYVVLSVVDLVALEKKYDDGLPRAGDIIGSRGLYHDGTDYNARDYRCTRQSTADQTYSIDRPDTARCVFYWYFDKRLP